MTMKKMSKKAVFLAFCLTALLSATGCQQGDSVIKGGSAYVELKRISFEGHTYIVDVAYRHGGITHDPDCQHAGR